MTVEKYLQKKLEIEQWKIDCDKKLKIFGSLECNRKAIDNIYNTFQILLHGIDQLAEQLDEPKECVFEHHDNKCKCNCLNCNQYFYLSDDCDNCNKGIAEFGTAKYLINNFNYCPNCGAKIKREVKE
jgi:hypothetical protein